MIDIDRNACDACGTCVGVCPVDAMTLMGRDLLIDHESCIMCRSCIGVCPVSALREVE